MICKEADDARRDIRTLERLLALDPDDMERQYRIGDQLRYLAAGMRHERDVAHLMKLHYGSSRDWAVLHDLRIEHDGDVAQMTICSSTAYSNSGSARARASRKA